MKQGMSKLPGILAVMLLILGLSLTAEGAASGPNKTVYLTAGKADTVDLGKTVADVLVANPAIADVGSLRANRLYIVGKTVGDTNVLAFDDVGNPLANIAVHVRVDEKTLRDTMREFFPEEDVQIKTVNSNVILSGSVSTPAVARQVRDLASRFVGGDPQTLMDLMTVGGEQQVMLKVRVVEAKRSVLREYGFETDYKPGSTGGTLNTIAGTGLAALTPFASGQIFVDDNGKFGPLKVGLSALEREGLVNVLAEPNLTAISGETAGFLAGGEFPVPTGTDQDGNITIEFKQFGVSLNFTPVVLSKGNISLHLSTEVSTLSQEDGVTLVGTDIPGLAVRRAETTVEMGSGGTIMIAGLIKSDTADSVNGLPGIKDVPVLGNLFKSKSFQRNETELVIIVTPYLVKPYARPEAEVASSEASALKVSAAAAAGGESEKNPQDGNSPLSKKFFNNMQTVYGDRMQAAVRTNNAYGYIVD